MSDARGELDKWGARLWEDLRALECAEDDRAFIEKAITVIGDLETLMTQVRGVMQRRLALAERPRETE